MRFWNILNSVNVKSFKLVGERVKHHLSSADVALTVVANKDMLIFRVDRYISLEVIKLLFRKGFKIICCDELGSTRNITSEQGWHRMHSFSAIACHLSKLLKFGEVTFLTHIFVQVGASGQEHKISYSIIWPFLGPLSTKIQFTIECKDAGINNLPWKALVDPRWKMASATKERIIDI